MPDDQHAPVQPQDDPIVAEVRAIREVMSAEAGHDLHRLYERFREREAAERAAGREVVAPPRKASSSRILRAGK